MKTISPVDIAGIEIGHATDEDAGTGCTVIICRKGAVAGVDVRGGGPATRETDLLRPENMVERINAVMLSGGSAFGLDASSGAMRWLEERGSGFDVGIGVVPIVCAASLFDLTCGRPDRRPDAAMGYEACERAREGGPLEEGCVGAGTGATVGKAFGMERAMKAGIGAAGFEVEGVRVAALSAVNALGTVVDAGSTPLAGLLASDGSHVLPIDEAVSEMAQALGSLQQTNTTISCVVTNATLTKAQATKVAQISHDGYARAIFPVHTSGDGDTVFVMATGEVPASFDLVGMLAAQSCEEAIRRGVTQAHGSYGFKACRDLT
jgi:L-aminopeptidase/D-esterase-like protein